MIVYMSIILTLLYTVYAVYTMKRFPDSLSETYYGLKGKGWLFPVFAVTQGIMLMPMLLDNVGNYPYSFLVFFICMFTIFAGVTYKYKEDMDDRVMHYTSAIFMAVCVTLLYILLGQFTHLICCMIPSGLCCIIKKECWVFWLELGLLFAVYLLLLW